VNNVNQPPTLNQPANMTVAQGAATDQVITGSDPDGNSLTFTKAAGPTFVTVTTTNATTGNVHAAPSTSDATGSYPVTVAATDNGSPPLTDSKSFTVAVTTGPNRAPTLNAIANMTVDEGKTADQTITGSDADGDSLTFTKVNGSPLFMTVTTTNATTGNVHLAPGFADAGSYTGAVQASDGKGGTDSKSFSITVNNVNRAPTANAGGPYNGVVGIPVNFDGSASMDADGDALTFAWNFGDGGTGSGPTPSHTYTATGTYTVTLTVTDNGTPVMSDTDATTATISNELPARVFETGGNTTIRLAAGKPKWCAQVEPVGGDYSNNDVVLASIVMKYGTKQISADATRTVLDSDKDGNGIQEITACFTKADLRILFAGLASGHNLVTVTIQGNLTTGARFSGDVQVDVVSNGSFTASAASVSPNPLNPEATLTFITSKPGMVRVEMFDIQGRLVRSILDPAYMAAGYHDVRIDGRGQSGERLASGVYFVRGVTPDGIFKNTITILK